MNWLLQIGYYPIVFIFFACMFMVLEIPLRQARKQPWFNRESLIDFCYGLLNHLNSLTLMLGLGYLLQTYIIKPYLPMNPLAGYIEDWPFILQLIVAILILDIYQYWRHRFSHRFFWKIHASHHSAPELRWSVHYRFHPVEQIYNDLGMMLYLTLFGFSLIHVWWVGIIMMVNNMYQHCNIDLRMPGWLRYVVTSPNYHKWHHATKKEAQDKNFADFFPVLDVLFGTYYYPENGKVFPKRYGVQDFPEGAPYYRSWWQQLLYPFKA